MREYYIILRNNEHHQDYLNFADRYLINAFDAYKDCYFLSKKKRLRLIKELAIKQLMDVEHNLCGRGWTHIDWKSGNVEVVREFVLESMNTIDDVTTVKLK